MVHVKVYKTQLNEDVMVINCWKCNKIFLYTSVTSRCPSCKAPAIDVKRLVYDIDDRVAWHAGKKSLLTNR